MRPAHLIKNVRILLQCQKPMRATFWNEEGVPRYRIEPAGDPATSAGTLGPNIDDDIIDGAGGHPHDFGFGMWRVAPVHAAQSMFLHISREIYLRRDKLYPRARKFLGTVDAREKSARIAMGLALNLDDSRNFRRREFHS